MAIPTFNDTQPKIFNQFLVVVNFYQRKIVDLKILQSDWLRAFWPISQRQDFSQI